MQKLAVITGGNGATAQAIAKVFKNPLTPGSKELDVTSPLEVHAFMELHKPDIVVNCAGYIVPESVKDSNAFEWQKQINVNLMGTYYCTKYALLNGATKIINIASAGGFKGRKDWSAYCAAKAGVISLTESLAEEGIDVYCISPHRIDTKMRHDLFPDENKDTLMSPSAIADEVEKIMQGAYHRGAHLDVALSGTTIISNGDS
jgi:3-oxoacyl-[acyl-carrier protein] reductase